MSTMMTIEQQFASIGVETTRAQMHISMPSPLQMKIAQEPAQMTIERENPEFKVNWRKVQAETGRRAPVEMSRHVRDKARAQAMNSIGTTVQDGNFLGKVENPGNRVAQLQKRKALETGAKEVNIQNMPKSIPEVEWKRGSININWSRHQLNVEWDGEYMPEIGVNPPYSVEIFLRNKPYVKITVEEMADPQQAGQHVDKKL